MDTQLPHDIGAVRPDGLGTNLQSGAHRFRGLPFGYQASDFQLAMSEQFSRR